MTPILVEIARISLPLSVIARLGNIQYVAWKGFPEEFYEQAGATNSEQALLEVLVSWLEDNDFVEVENTIASLFKADALIGYQLKNTLSDHGGVTRGICSVEDSKLTGIALTKNIVKTVNGAEADGKAVDVDSLVSMNFWCYPASFMDVLKGGFPEFLKNMTDPMKDEYLLPIIADGMLKEGTEFTVLPTDDHWFGVTYKEDKPSVEAAFQKLIEDGEYKADLYSDL